MVLASGHARVYYKTFSLRSVEHAANTRLAKILERPLRASVCGGHMAEESALSKRTEGDYYLAASA